MPKRAAADVGGPSSSKARRPSAAETIASFFVFVVISDTHGQTYTGLPSRDDEVVFPPGAVAVLVHCGDWQTLPDKWLRTLKGYEYIIYIGGNHDQPLKRLADKGRQLSWPAGQTWLNYADALTSGQAQQFAEGAGVVKRSIIKHCAFLHSTGVVLNLAGRDLKIFGTACHWDPGDKKEKNAPDKKEAADKNAPDKEKAATNLHFAYKSEDELRDIYALIPDDVHVLITHAGVKGILDATGDGEHLGSEALGERVGKLPHLCAHVFGHVHALLPMPEGGGSEPQLTLKAQRKYMGKILDIEKNDGLDVRAVSRGRTVFANAAVLKVAAGQHRLKHTAERNAPADPQGQLRPPVVLRIVPARTTGWIVDAVWRQPDLTDPTGPSCWMPTKVGDQ